MVLLCRGMKVPREAVCLLHARHQAQPEPRIRPTMLLKMRLRREKDAM